MPVLYLIAIIRKFAFVTINLELRGAITVGKFHHSENNAFGPAIVDAVSFEKIAAKYARVVLTEKLMQALPFLQYSEMLQIYDYVDEPCFCCGSTTRMSYIDWYHYEMIQIIINEEQSNDEYLSNTRSTILSMLRAKIDTPYFEKYLWLGKAFNQFLDNKFEYLDSSLHTAPYLIDLSEFQ